MLIAKCNVILLHRQTDRKIKWMTTKGQIWERNDLTITFVQKMLSIMAVFTRRTGTTSSTETMQLGKKLLLLLLLLLLLF